MAKTERRDKPCQFRELTDIDRIIADNLQTFLEAEVKNSPIYDGSV